ncbi:MAG: prolyl aminopeptidase [Holophagaceae bacterium]|nr:prolyl aminopeptidase [Holophagaceae bacterium]
MTAPMKDPRSWLYPALDPFQTGHLRVSGLHEVYFEVSGNPEGKPVVFLHGGPGGATSPKHRRFFDPRRYRIVLLDQRGCGLSRPYGELRENSTWELVADLERLREHLGIERWQVFGGSWGSTLALAYSQAHPACVTELVLRGIFLSSTWELDWFYRGGASALYPDVWETFLAAIPEAEQGDLLQAYLTRLISEDPEIQTPAVKAWCTWEGALSNLYTSAEAVADLGEDALALAFSRLEAHYFAHGSWLGEGQLLAGIEKIRHLPATIIQGRYDVVCPMKSAWELHRAWPEAEFLIVPDAGHGASEPGISKALVAATDRFACGPDQTWRR